jgi:coenzyme F420 hydrogenase subunit beta
MVCLPDQAAALRLLQLGGFAPALRITHVLGPYTGTALYPAAIRAYLRMHGVHRDDAITRLRWRAGDWPGYLEIVTASGRVLRSPKVYYNFLIPFFVTHTSLQHPDFGNEFVDLSVGDAWSPTLEASGGGHSVMVTRAAAMERFVATLVAEGVLTAEDIDPLQATEMHGHMIDFKKRGSHIRNRLRRVLGRRVPDFHMVPAPLPAARVAVEVVIIIILALCSNPLARWVLGFVPERIIGPVFNRTRLTWKRLSKPTKRKGLAELECRETP